MDAFFTSPPDVLLPGAAHLAVALGVASAVAWLRPGSMLRRWRWPLLALLTWTWIGSAPMAANWALTRLEGPLPMIGAAPPPADPASLVVVLASGDVSTRGGERRARPDLAGWERLREGVALWRRTGGQLVIVGGERVGEGGAASIAEAMASLAGEWGVPAHAVRAVSGSTRTREDLQNVAPLVRAHAGPVWLVTSAAHMPRAAGVATALGLAVRPFPCDYRQVPRLTAGAWWPNAGGPALWSEVLYEWIGWGWYRLRGWA